MSLCPCGSEKEFSACCEPIIDGSAKASSAENLMRSRYTAHVVKNYAYLNTSTHPEFRDEADEKEIEQWSSNLNWTGLEIHATEKGLEGDTEGFVSFSAHYTINEIPQQLTENASFRKEDDTWYYVEGEVLGSEPYRREGPKVGRNDPCTCGSGKKFKKCCGAN